MGQRGVVGGWWWSVESGVWGGWGLGSGGAVADMRSEIGSCECCWQGCSALTPTTAHIGLKPRSRTMATLLSGLKPITFLGLLWEQIFQSAVDIQCWRSWQTSGSSHANHSQLNWGFGNRFTGVSEFGRIDFKKQKQKQNKNNAERSISSPNILCYIYITLNSHIS